MRKAKRKQRQLHNETTPQPLHPIGCERYYPVDVTCYDGDLPTGEPVDWFAQSDEFDSYPLDEYDGYEIDDKYLWDEW